MTSTDGLGDSKEPIKLVPGTSLSGVQLSAQEGFVLSRVDGFTPASMICEMTGLGRTQTLKLLAALVEKGLVQVGDSAKGTASGGAKAESKPGASERAKSTGIRGRATITPPGGNPSVSTSTNAGVSKSVRESGTRESAKARGGSTTKTNRAKQPDRDLAPAPDPEDDTIEAAEARLTDEERATLDQDETDGITLKRAVRIKVNEIHRQLKSMTFFELLGVPIDANEKRIRRAYFRRSKEYHPDRYYTKNVGYYKDRLNDIFTQINSAYEFLLDESQREAYRSTLEQHRQNQELQQQLARRSQDELEELEALKAKQEDIPPGKGSSTSSVKALERAASRSEQSSVGKETAETSSSYSMHRPRRVERISITTDNPRSTTKQTASSGSEPAEEVADDDPDRAVRRQADRDRRRRFSTHHPMVLRRKKARSYYEQGIKQLEEGKSLAAAASLKLATTFDPAEKEYQHAYERAAYESRHITADNHFKRAAFEESVGRFEAAADLYCQAADACPEATYLIKAAEVLHMVKRVAEAKEYGAKAVSTAPDSAVARVLLAKILLDAGMLENARREAEMGLKIEPGNKEIKALLKQIRRT